MGDIYHVASAEPQTMSKKSPSSALSEILLTVNDNSEPLVQHPTNLGKPTVSSSIGDTSTLDVDDYLVPQPSSQADFNFPAAYTPFKIPIGNTDGDIVVEVAPIPAPSSPSRSWTVITQGSVLSARQPGAQGQCSGVANKRETSVAQRNSERQIPSPGLATRQPAPGQEQ